MNWLKSTVHKFYRFWKLDKDSKWLLLQAFVLLPLVTLFLKFSKLNHTQTVLMWLLPTPNISLNESDRFFKIKNTVQMVQLAANSYPWANCLPKSLVLWRLLHRQGIDSELRIGVHRDTKAFEAHAWVEYEGFALNDASDVRSRFAMFNASIGMPFENNVRQNEHHV